MSTCRDSDSPSSALAPAPVAHFDERAQGLVYARRRTRAIVALWPALTSSTGASSWSTWREAPVVVLRNLRSTVTIALVVGTVLFCINQLDVVIRGDATTLVWLKAALTYAVPLIVSNLGVLTATRSADRSK